MLKSTAQVDGNIKTDRLVVEEGAQFTGECQMGTPIAVNGEPDEDETPTDDAPDTASDETEEDEETAEASSA